MVAESGVFSSGASKLAWMIVKTGGVGMFKGIFAVLALAIFLVVFIRWFVKSERELKEATDDV